MAKYLDESLLFVLGHGWRLKRIFADKIAQLLDASREKLDSDAKRESAHRMVSMSECDSGIMTDLRLSSPAWYRQSLFLFLQLEQMGEAPSHWRSQLIHGHEILS
jgi:hypothetical protein